MSNTAMTLAFLGALGPAVIQVAEPTPTPLWILATGAWNDNGVWDDNATWNDGV